MSASPHVRAVDVPNPQACGRNVPPPNTEGVPAGRPVVRGKFIYVGEQKLLLRGVTYGTFSPGPTGADYPEVDVVERDFSQIAANGFNTVRTYTVPPRWVLDVAARHGLRVLVGLPWEQHITFLNDRTRMASIEGRVREGVSACLGHPAVLAYSIGNEIPAPIARWHGREPLQRFLRRLYEVAKRADPQALVTYVNYPTTEYLELPFLDFVCFNVYLESQKNLEAYLARLQHLAGERPLIMAEIGLDSRRHGPVAQARVIEWQIRTAMASGCAGAFVFAWTDDWHRGGHDVLDWDFGLTTRQRVPKEALAAARDAFADAPFARRQEWPRISVVVCTFNGARTIQQCLQGLSQLDYPNYEIIVVNDGSTDRTAEIAARVRVNLITTENRGLSHARNTGLAAASGEIIAYIDDDAWPDPHWLLYLAATFGASSHVGVGGPNIAPPDTGFVAQCVLNAPGGPLHVMLSDTEAEHIPGCNMAFRREALEAVGGFDPNFHAAGDDVDLCWRLQERGWTLGFSPAAVVWHHRRGSVVAFWRQQKGYGKAEALLERKWPEKYNSVGHVKWNGRLYGKGLPRILGQAVRIYHGVWGSAPFQPLQTAAPGLIGVLPTLPEWYLLIFALAGLSLLGVLWPWLYLALPLLALTTGATLLQAGLSAARAHYPVPPPPCWHRVWRFFLTAGLHLLQPMARLYGRVRSGLTAWRLPLRAGWALPVPTRLSVWSESWQPTEQILEGIIRGLREDGVSVSRGGSFDRWDLEVRRGLFGTTRLLMAIEEHGGGRQYHRFEIWPRLRVEGWAALIGLGGLAAGAFLDQAHAAGWVLACMGGVLAGRIAHCSASAMAAVKRAVAATAAPATANEP